MRVMLINPPFLPRFSRSHRMPGVVKSGHLFYPYWLALAAAVLKDQGHTIDLLDCPAAGINLEQLLPLVATFDPGLVILESSAPSWYADCETAEAIKQQQRHAAICLTGNHVTALWRETMQRAPAVDHIALGEYELTVTELADALDKQSKPETIPGLACRGHLAGADPAPRPLNTHLDDLPMVAPIYKDFLRAENYSFNLSRHPFIQIMAGRGCSSRCFFCAWPQTSHGHEYRFRSAENIVDEMLWVQTKWPEIKQINIEDENFAEERAFARRLGDEARGRNLTLPLHANISTSMEVNSLEALHKAGLRSCSVGFDTSRFSLLATMGKKESDQSITTFMNQTRRLGILVHGCFMVGFPGENRESMEEILHWASQINPDSAEFNPVMPYPGTGSWQYYQYHGYLATNNFRTWLTREGYPRCVVNLPGLTPAEIDHFCDQAFVRFHRRPVYIATRLYQAIRNPEEGYRSLLACLQFSRYLRRVKANPPAPLDVTPIPRTQTWGTIPPLPEGRMEQLAHIP